MPRGGALSLWGGGNQLGEAAPGSAGGKDCTGRGGLEAGGPGRASPRSSTNTRTSSGERGET